jgi:hypothetical protein
MAMEGVQRDFGWIAERKNPDGANAVRDDLS